MTMEQTVFRNVDIQNSTAGELQRRKYTTFRTRRKFEIKTISFVTSVRPSVRPSVSMELGSHWTDFHEIWHLRVFRKSVEKIKISLKTGKSSGHFAWRPMCIYGNTLLNSSLNENCLVQNLYRKSKHTFYFQKPTFPKVVSFIWDNVAKLRTARQTTDDNIIRRILFACWIIKSYRPHNQNT